MLALVTGGAGFIGSHLVDRLLSLSYEVVVVDNFSSGSWENLAAAQETANGSHLQIIEVDIRDAELPALVQRVKPDVVFHLAAQMNVRRSVLDPGFDCDVNIAGTINLLQAAAQSPKPIRIVFASSGGCIYGPPNAAPVDEEFRTRPHSPYGASKLAAEIYLGVFRHLYNTSFTSLALGNVYGPRQEVSGEAGVVAIFGTALLTGQRTSIYGDGTSSRDYIFVADVVSAFVLAATRGSATRYNIGSGTPTRIDKLHERIARVCESTSQPDFLPSRPGELLAITLNPQKAISELGWKPRWGLQEGIHSTVEWIRDRIT